MGSQIKTPGEAGFRDHPVGEATVRVAFHGWMTPDEAALVMYEALVPFIELQIKLCFDDFGNDPERWEPWQLRRFVRLIDHLQESKASMAAVVARNA